jgi:hypothetical protein
MKTLAVLTTIAAWACILLLPRSTGLRVLQLLVFGLLGTVFTLAGGFQYWWNSGMLPSQKSALILVCGLLTLLSQAGTLLQGMLSDEGGSEWAPPSKRRR